MQIKINLSLFILIGLFYFTSQLEIYAIFMLFIIIHELGHLIVGILFGLKPNKLELMPLGISISFGLDTREYNYKIRKGNLLSIKKIIIALAGPITNIIIALIYIMTDITSFGIQREYIIYSNLLISIFNFLPIYPLDGGRICKTMLHIFCGLKKSMDYTNSISRMSIILLTAICSIAILYIKNVAILLILGYLWLIFLRENKRYEMKKNIYNILEGYNS